MLVVFEINDNQLMIVSDKEEAVIIIPIKIKRFVLS